MQLEPDVHAALEQARRHLWAAHAADPNFTGCGIGLRRRAGRLVEEPVVIAMMVKKLRPGFVSQRRLLPSTVHAAGTDWGVDVVEVGRLTRHGTTTTAATLMQTIPEKIRPPLQGAGILNATSTAPVVTGSIGCFVRDNSDKTINIMSSSHVLGLMIDSSKGQTILQPSPSAAGGPGEGIAKVKRTVPISDDPTATNYVDAGIAQLTDQTAYGQGVARNLMPAISATHPAVGMVVAGDAGSNCYVARMDRTLTALGVSLLPATPSSPCVVAPTVNTNIEKVGCASGYSSSTIDAIGAQVKIDFSNDPQSYSDPRVLQDLIWTQAFATWGDSGSVVCIGGDGMTFVVPPRTDCSVLGAAGTYYNLPLTSDNTLTSQARDEFFAQSLVGNLLISVLYQNSQVVIDRLAGKTATADAQSYAHGFYTRYHDLMASVLANPASTATVTSQNIGDLQNVILGMSGAFGAGPPVLTPAETKAAMALQASVIEKLQGMNRTQVLAFMNETSVYQNVLTQLSAIPTIEVSGPVTAF
jgi:hypothetical protein